MNPITWFRRRAQAPLTDESMLAFRTAAAEAQRSRLPQMAAALSYRTVFGLIPVIVVALLFVRHREDRMTIVHNVIEYAGLNTITIDESSVKAFDEERQRRRAARELAQHAANPDPAAPTPIPPPRAPADTMGPPLPPRTLESWITDLIDRAESGISLKAISIVGLATLIYAAVAMLVEIELAFNQIFRVPRGRSWIRRVVNYWTLLTLGAIGLAGTFYVGAKFQLWAAEIVKSQGLGVGSGALTVHLIGYGVTVFISTVMLTLLYATVPNTRVKPMAAIVGAVISALLWEAGKWGFGQFIEYSTSYAKLYGSLALVPLFLLWVYYTWLIVLFGLAVTYQFQHGRLKTNPQPLSDFGPTIVEPSACLLVMTAMARAMAIGTPQSLKAIGLSTGLSEPVVSIVVARFAERGLLLRVERGNEGSDTHYALARNPTMIRVGEILSLGFELAGGPESNPVVERMRRAQIDAAGSETLADISGNPGEPRKRLTPASPTVAATVSSSTPVLPAAPAVPPAPPTPAATPTSESNGRPDGPLPSRTATL